MNNEIKREIEKIEIPEELHARAELGIKQVKQSGTKKKWYPKWVIGAAAILMITGISFSSGGSYLANAGEVLIGKLLGTEEQEEIFETFPEEAELYLTQTEQHLSLARQHLSAEDFADYSQLIEESIKMDLQNAGNSDVDQDKMDSARLILQKKLKKYGIHDLTNHTIEEARTMVNYPLNHPTYIPEGYQLIEELILTEETNVGKDPDVSFQYGEIDGEFNFYTFIEKIDSTKWDRLTSYEKLDSYTLNGYTFEHAYDEGKYHSNVQAMRVTIPEDDYEVIISASLLSKEEMEKVVLSMIE